MKAQVSFAMAQWIEVVGSWILVWLKSPVELSWLAAVKLGGEAGSVGWLGYMVAQLISLSSAGG